MKKIILNKVESRARKARSIKKRKNLNGIETPKERKEEIEVSQANPDLLNVQEKNEVENNLVQALVLVVLHLQALAVNQDPKLNQRTQLCMIIT